MQQEGMGMTLRARALGALIFAILILGLVPAVVSAVDPPVLTETVHDETGRLDGGEDRIASAAEALKTESDITMYVLWLQGLDGEEPAQFVERVATANSLADARNVILMVSMADRKIGLWSSGKTDITASELDGIREGSVVPRLQAGDFVGAVEAAAVGFKNADAAAAPAPAAPQTPSRPAIEGPSIDWSVLMRVLFGLVLLTLAVVVIFFVVMAVRNYLAARRTKQEAIARMERLAADAQRTLLKADEEMRDAEQEFQFAQASYGEEELAPFKATLESARAEMREAYELGQQIDDDKPESYEERAVMFESITTRTNHVSEMIAKQMKAIEELRDLEARAAEAVEKYVKGKGARTRRVNDAATVVARLEAHAPSVAGSVAKNVPAAEALHEVADRDLAAAQKAIDAGQRSQAALLVRSAEESLAKAQTALDAVDQLGEALAEAEKKLDSEMKSAAADIETAAAAVARGQVFGLDGALRQARQDLARARREVEDESPDYIVAYQLAIGANGLADEVLQDVRDEEARRVAAKRQAEAQVRAAAVNIAQAKSYIEQHRSKVGRKARNRLSEAERQYEEVSRHSDIFASAAAATAATDLANESYRTARSDVSSYDSQHTSYSSGSSYSSPSSSSGSYRSSSSSSSGSSWKSSNDSFSIGSFGGFSSGGSFGGGGGGSSSGGGW